jgi:hypothetical protein
MKDGLSGHHRHRIVLDFARDEDVVDIVEN